MTTNCSTILTIINIGFSITLMFIFYSLKYEVDIITDHVFHLLPCDPEKCFQKLDLIPEMKPWLQPRDAKIFMDGLSKHKRYFEIGSGGSTYQAIKNGLLIMGSIESDRKWHEQLKLKIPQECGANLILVDFYTINSLGWPAKNTTLQDYIRYFDSYRAEYKADMIFIDGRFRVAAALSMLKYIDNNTDVFIDNFLDRPFYHVILEFYNIIESGETLVHLKKNGKTPSNKLIETYQTNPN